MVEKRNNNNKRAHSRECVERERNMSNFQLNDILPHWAEHFESTYLFAIQRIQLLDSSLREIIHFLLNYRENV